MQLAPVVRAAPMQIAEVLRTHLGTPPGIGEVSVAPPGFINMRLDPAWVAGQRGRHPRGRARVRRVRVAAPHRINVEFVSANPTGPLTVGNARGAFVGDLLSRVLEAVGHQVTREYYFNDFNAQVRNLGLSVAGAPRGSRGAGGRLPRRLRERAGGPGAGRALGRGRRARRRSGRGAGPLGIGAGARRDRGQPGRAGRALRRLDSRRARSTPRVGSSGPWTSCGPRATSTRPMARPGSAPRPTATTRIGSSSAATASPPTSPRTSATWPRSSAAASTSSSTCGARTTTARWRATGPPPRRSASRPSTCSTCSWPGSASCATARRSA